MDNIPADESAVKAFSLSRGIWKIGFSISFPIHCLNSLHFLQFIVGSGSGSSWE